MIIQATCWWFIPVIPTHERSTILGRDLNWLLDNSVIREEIALTESQSEDWVTMKIKHYLAEHYGTSTWLEIGTGAQHSTLVRTANTYWEILRTSLSTV